MTESTDQSSLIKDLWERRFFQYFATYIGASWAAIQFGEWLVRRYGFSDSIIEKIIVFLLICLPAFLVFVYNHGRHGHDEWKPLEKKLIPASLLLAIGVSTFGFGTEAKAETIATAVNIETETGEVITRQVPTVESSRRAVFFPFENKNKNDKEDWMRFGIPFLMDKDLEQDMRIFSINPTSLKDDYESLDLDYKEAASFSNMVKIAKDNYSDFFITGSFESGDQNKLLVKVYDSKSAKLFLEKELEGTDYFEMIDEFSEELTNKIYLKKEFGDTEMMIDLPSRDLVASSFEAFRHYMLGMLSFAEDVNAPEKTAAHFSKSIDLDEKCSECYVGLAYASAIQVDIEGSKKHITKANQLASSLPERQRLNIQHTYYQYKQEPEKARLLLTTWKKLYPSDFTPYAYLMNNYSNTLEWDKAKEVGQEALKAGHRGSVLSQLANLYISTNEFDEAEKYLKEFAKLYPHKSRKSNALSDLYIKKGEWDKAKTHLEKVNVTNPDDIPTILSLGDLEAKTGHYDRSLEYYNNALAQCDHVQDSVNVYTNFEDFYTRSGQINKVLEYEEKRLAMMRTYMPLTSVDWTKLRYGFRYLWIDQEDKLTAHVNEMKKDYGQNPMTSCSIDWTYFYFTEKPEEFKECNLRCEEMLMASMGQNIKYLNEAMQYKFDGDYEKSIASFQMYVDSTGFSNEFLGETMSEVFRKAGKLKEAKAFIQKILKNDPTYATYLLELARVQVAEGDKAEAKKTLDQCLDIWKNADAEYIYYKNALELQASLN